MLKVQKMDSNEMLKEKIENGIDKNLFFDYVNIQVLESEVTIKGFVKSRYDKDRIESITRNTAGVISVNNELAINY